MGSCKKSFIWLRYMYVDNFIFTSAHSFMNSESCVVPYTVSYGRVTMCFYQKLLIEFFLFFVFSIHNFFHHGSPYVYASTFCRLPANQDKRTHGCSRFVFQINLHVHVNISNSWYFRFRLL